jgi:hypothetical protein
MCELLENKLPWTRKPRCKKDRKDSKAERQQQTQKFILTIPDTSQTRHGSLGLMNKQKKASPCLAEQKFLLVKLWGGFFLKNENICILH